MPESNRPIIDLLMPRAIPLSYGQTLSDQESEYTVNATFDAHEAFANFATNQWRNARTGFFRAMTVVLIVSLIFYFFVSPPHPKYLDRVGYAGHITDQHSLRAR